MEMPIGLPIGLPLIRTATSSASCSLQSIPSIDHEMATSLEPLEKKYLSCGAFEKWQQERRTQRREAATEQVAVVSRTSVDSQAAASLQPMRKAYLSTADFLLWRQARRQSAEAQRVVDSHA